MSEKLSKKHLELPVFLKLLAAEEKLSKEV